MSVDQSTVLGIFAKQPSPGLVKSRLAKETAPEWAAQVAEAFLGDLLERLRSLSCKRTLVYSPPTAESYFTTLARTQFDLAVQSDGDLGSRMYHFVQSQFQTGANRVILLGMDSPTVPLSYIEEAIAELANVDVVIGPATDGGYYLIGYRKLVPELFQDIAWSSETVLLETANRCRSAGLSLHVLPPWYDVDTLADWRMLRGHLAALRLAGKPIDLPRTERIRDWHSD